MHRSFAYLKNKITSIRAVSYTHLDVYKRQAREYGACVAAMPVKDTIKIADEAGFADYTPNRNLVWMMQTPQAFSYPLVRGAYDCLASRGAAGLSVTDDAMVVETFTDHKVKFVEGSYRNIKVTTPEDMLIGEAFLNCSRSVKVF